MWLSGTREKKKEAFFSACPTDPETGEPTALLKHKSRCLRLHGSSEYRSAELHRGEAGEIRKRTKKRLEDRKKEQRGAEN